MEIKEVTVTVHEKRNHPFVYGHYDCEVSFVADVNAGDSIDQSVSDLRTVARSNVQEELDDWEHDILIAKEKEEREARVVRDINSLSYRYGYPDYDECRQDVVDKIVACPKDEQAYFFDVLDSVEEQAKVDEDDIPF